MKRMTRRGKDKQKRKRRIKMLVAGAAGVGVIGVGAGALALKRKGGSKNGGSTGIRDSFVGKAKATASGAYRTSKSKSSRPQNLLGAGSSNGKSGAITRSSPGGAITRSSPGGAITRSSPGAMVTTGKSKPRTKTQRLLPAGKSGGAKSTIVNDAPPTASTPGTPPNAKTSLTKNGTKRLSGGGKSRAKTSVDLFQRRTLIQNEIDKINKERRIIGKRKITNIDAPPKRMKGAGRGFKKQLRESRRDIVKEAAARARKANPELYQTSTLLRYF